MRPADLTDYDTIVQRLQGSPGVERIITAGPQVDALAGLRDGLRVVFVFTETQTALNEIEFFGWKRMYQKYE